MAFWKFVEAVIGILQRPWVRLKGYFLPNATLLSKVTSAMSQSLNSLKGFPKSYCFVMYCGTSQRLLKDGQESSRKVSNSFLWKKNMSKNHESHTWSIKVFNSKLPTSIHIIFCETRASLQNLLHSLKLKGKKSAWVGNIPK